MDDSHYCAVVLTSRFPRYGAIYCQLRIYQHRVNCASASNIFIQIAPVHGKHSFCSTYNLQVHRCRFQFQVEWITNTFRGSHINNFWWVHSENYHPEIGELTHRAQVETDTSGDVWRSCLGRYRETFNLCDRTLKMNKRNSD